MKRSLIFKTLSIAMVVAGIWGCSSKQIAQKGGNEVYDDLYAQVGETNTSDIVFNDIKKQSSLNQNPDGQAGDRSYSENENLNNEYYSESGIDARDYKRNSTDRPGYSDYTDGYRDGMADSRFNWGNSWNNGFGSFNRYNYGGFGFNNFYNPGLTIILGGRNRFGNFYNPYSPFGLYDPYYAYSPWGFGSFNSFGYGGFYDPFYSNYNNFGFNNYYGGGFGNGWYSAPRYYSGNYNHNNGNILGADRARNYGPRNSGRNSAGYNDQFVNTAKPRPNADPNMRKGTVYNDPSGQAASYGSGAGYSARPRGGYSGTSTTASPNTNPQLDGANSATQRSANTYSARPRGGYAATGNTNTSQNATNSNSNARPSAATVTDNNTYYTRPSRSAVNWGSRAASGSNNNSNNSGNYSGSNSSNTESYTPSRSSWGNSGSSSGSSSGGYSGGSSSSSGGGGSSRGSSGGSSSGGSSSGSSGGSRGSR